ncbi:hypothetical protein GLW08_06855 [Pontibacillus yanchengensis]|uniref:Uncharacterized protein n=1 Tax=Pontibacillus yanchengensis TaxID=462910 RepID=A0ACC7VFQ8_9BACI|nr:hypothetical protein [Pontibacillus yanchengensis]MYL53056.1 hypothetical protein [Pontibacillus yanchengensis]
MKKLISTDSKTPTKKPVPSSNHYIKPVKKVRFTQQKLGTLSPVQQPSWEAFFSSSKTDPKLIGFEKRSRRKFKNLYLDNEMIVAEAAKMIEIVQKENGSQISLKETSLESLNSVIANHSGIVFSNKEKVAFLNLHTYESFEWDFEWKPFTFALGEDFFVNWNKRNIRRTWRVVLL